LRQIRMLKLLRLARLGKLLRRKKKRAFSVNRSAHFVKILKLISVVVGLYLFLDPNTTSIEHVLTFHSSM